MRAIHRVRVGGGQGSESRAQLMALYGAPKSCGNVTEKACEWHERVSFGQAEVDLAVSMSYGAAAAEAARERVPPSSRPHTLALPLAHKTLNLIQSN